MSAPTLWSASEGACRRRRGHVGVGGGPTWHHQAHAQQHNLTRHQARYRRRDAPSVWRLPWTAAASHLPHLRRGRALQGQPRARWASPDSCSAPTTVSPTTAAFGPVQRPNNRGSKYKGGVGLGNAASSRSQRYGGRRRVPNGEPGTRPVDRGGAPRIGMVKRTHVGIMPMACDGFGHRDGGHCDRQRIHREVYPAVLRLQTAGTAVGPRTSYVRLEP